MRPMRSAPRPSIVTTFLPATAETGVVHALTAWPPTSTVQAPHTAMPQPNLVPVNPNSSRTTHISGVSGGDADETDFPFRIKLVAMRLPSLSHKETRRELAPQTLVAWTARVHARAHVSGGNERKP